MIKDIYKYDSVKVALYIVAWANHHKVGINLTKTQKLLYVAYGANLVISRDRLCNEHPQAWPFGPVFARTRKRLLKEKIYSIDFNLPELQDLKDDKYIRQLMQFVFAGFGEKSASQLTSWSHEIGSPWAETTHLPNFKWGMEIPDEFIAKFFSKHIKIISKEN